MASVASRTTSKPKKTLRFDLGSTQASQQPADLTSLEDELPWLDANFDDDDDDDDRSETSSFTISTTVSTDVSKENFEAWMGNLRTPRPSMLTWKLPRNLPKGASVPPNGALHRKKERVMKSFLQEVTLNPKKLQWTVEFRRRYDEGPMPRETGRRRSRSQ
mmetsp:Transcript_57975/g.135819  ORF Transcript_57975/g.135819 Transcript_57975/m.135819 type:complete len:161 (+) Transcript_57975:79-561(+)